MKFLIFFFTIITLALNSGCKEVKMTEKSLHNPRVMAVFAHPDDETWINGTLALIADKGYPLQVIYATSGEQGSDRSGRGLTGQALATEREQEAKNALIALGVSTEPLFLHVGDSTLQENVSPLSDQLLESFTTFNPDIVITFGPGGITGHSDHSAIGTATSRAFDRLANASVLIHIAISEQRAQALSAIAAAHGVSNYLPQERVAKEAVTVSLALSKYSTQRQQSPKAHLTQFPAVILNAWEEFVEQHPVEEMIVSRVRGVEVPMLREFRE
jgi:N-acetylglucosamine malate deacetylase 2